MISFRFFAFILLAGLICGCAFLDAALQKEQPAQASPGERPECIEETDNITCYPHIDLTGENTKSIAVAYAFRFENVEYAFSMDVSQALIDSARNSSKSFSFYGHRPDKRWHRRYMQALLNDPAMKAFLDTLHQHLMVLSSTHNLDGNRTVEMLTAFVQQIPYQRHTGDPPKFPVETFAEKKGDCDDKSLLLLALLARSNFDVVAFDFEQLAHMAVGIRSDSMHVFGTDYTFIETTSESAVGFPFRKKEDPLFSEMPRLLHVEFGEKKYTASYQIEFMSQLARRLKTELDESQSELKALKELIEKAKQENSALVKRLKRASADSQNAKAQLEKYHEQIERTNALIARFNETRDRRAPKIDLYNQVITFDTDRYNTWNWVVQRLEKLSQVDPAWKDVTPPVKAEPQS